MSATFHCDRCGKDLTKPHKARHLKLCKKGISRLRSNAPHTFDLEEILQAFDNHDVANDALLKEAVHKCSLSTLFTISSECHDLWESSATPIPELFPSQECWSSREPSEEELFIAFLEPTTYQHAQVFENGEQIRSPAAAIWQLQHPNPQSPTYLMNATLQLSDNLRMCVPKGLLRKRTPYGNPTFAANLTPRHTVVDLHLDQCRDGLIQCVAQSRKVILMWPATVCNMEIMLAHSDHQMKFIRVGHLLQGGIIIITGSSVGLVMYTGTIHMTITLEAGILVGINWVASEGHRAAASCFRYEICAQLENDISSVLAIYGDQLEASLNGWNEVRHREVLEDWITIYPLLVRTFKSLSKTGVSELQKICQTIETSLQDHQTSKLSCCGCMPDEYGRHFRDFHIKNLNLLIQAGLKDSKKRKRA